MTKTKKIETMYGLTKKGKLVMMSDFCSQVDDGEYDGPILFDSVDLLREAMDNQGYNGLKVVEIKLEITDEMNPKKLGWEDDEKDDEDDESEDESEDNESESE
jgi:hypothetical protein